MVRKGVYMDGHEWADVVEYRNKAFLPTITKYEALVAKYEQRSHDDPELIKIMPNLTWGERRIIIQYHDECCFHANDEARNLW